MPQISALFIIVIMLGGCGDIYTKEETAPVSTAAAVNSGVHLGVFVDSPVKGVSYQTYLGTTASITGTTDKQGTFYYYPGETIKFYLGAVGEVLLGVPGQNVKAQPMLTPIELGIEGATEDQREDLIVEPAPTNLARFLQTIDTDSNLTNGIEVNSTIKTLASTSEAVYFADSITSFATSSTVTGLLNGRSLVEVNSSNNHLKDTVGVKFVSGTLPASGSSYISLWNLGLEYAIYSFTAISTTIQEESRYILKKANKTSSWGIDNKVLTLSGVKDSDNIAFSDQTIKMHALVDSGTYIVQNSDVYKDLGVFRKIGTQSFNTGEINGSHYTLLSPSGEYGIFDFNQSGTNALATFPQEANVTLTWSVNGSGYIETNGTVSGVERNDTIQALVNRGDLYRIYHTLERNGTTIHTNEIASFSGNAIPFFKTMIPGTYHCVTNKGLYYKLVLNSIGGGTISYLHDSVLETKNASNAITKWTISDDKLKLEGVYNDLANTFNITIYQSLEAVNYDTFFLKNISAFTSGVQEYTLMYKAQPYKTIAEIAASSSGTTYDLYFEEYNQTSGTMTKLRRDDEHQMVFKNDGTGYILAKDDTTERSNFTWSIDSLGRVKRTISSLSSSTMTLMHDYRGSIRVVDEFVINSTNEQYATRFYTLVKQ